MEAKEETHKNSYKEFTDDWNYDASCTLTSLPDWHLQYFKRLTCVVHIQYFVCLTIGP